MLEQQLLNRMRALIHSRAPERIDQFDLEISKIISLHAAKGMLGSGALIVAISNLGSSEVKIRILEARGSIQRVINELQVRYSNELNADIKGELGIHAREALDNVKTSIMKLVPHIIKNPEHINVDTAMERALNESAAEIDLYVDRIKLAQENKSNEKSQQNITVNAHQGIVQIGDYATASLTFNLNNDTREAIKRALDASNSLLAESSSISRSEELREIVSETYKELDKTNPNNSKLYSSLNVLTSAFQGIASASAVSEFLRTALTLFTG